MKQKFSMERGQALIVMALAAIGLFAIVALAIDGSAKFSDRRHAQNAADTAALAGALALGSEDAYWKIEALNRASDNGYNDDLVANNVDVYRCDEGGSSCGAYAGSSQYVQVIINSDVNTYFARVIGIFQTHNTVQAVALAKRGGPLYDGNSIVALSPTCSNPGTFLIGGSGEINVSGGGLYVNTDASGCGFEQQGCNITLNVDGDTTGITSVGEGNIGIDSNCSEQINADTTEGGDRWPFIPDMPEEPAECISPAGSYTSNSTTQKTTLYPGKYYDFPPKGTKSNPVFDDITMQPGVYCVETVLKLTDQHLILTGHDVTIYIRPGYYFSMSNGLFTLDAPDSGDYAGYLIIVASDFTGSATDCKIDGNGSDVFTGTIYAPYCNLTINGTSSATGYNSQIIAYTIKINGDSEINFTYDSDDNVVNKRKVGLMR